MISSGLKYLHSDNAGDYIQSIAVEQFQTNVHRRFNRDTLGIVPDNKKKYLLITNGWFSHQPEKCFPFSPCIVPLFFGFHITDWNNSWSHFCSKKSLEYLLEHQPIGCRDRFTAYFLKKHGIETYYSKCLTLTFPKRNNIPKKTKYLIVDANYLKIPGHILGRSEYYTHSIPEKYPEKVKFDLARQLLNHYKEKATAVITSRLHCALPCLAMGIPVVFFGNKNNYRTSILTDLGIEIHSPADIINWEKEIYNIDFNFIEKEKTSIITNLKHHMSSLYDRHSKK
ncbi:MAG: polysaccharide pyruvyl transferase family protein [Bacteroidales bacterium]|nr:polysaccharide pyruvyl transferase family protein [Bacteroidales bacterium]